MSTLFGRSGCDHSKTGHDLNQLLDHWWEPDTPYLTDGTSLYRYVGAAVSNTGEQLIGLEDCQSLKILLFDLNELRALGMRPVVGPTSTVSGTRHRPPRR